MVTFRQLEILFGFTYGEGPRLPDQKPVLRYVHKALANTFFARKATGTINEGEVKLLTMGIKPIISRTRMGRRSEETGHTQGISCLSLSSSKPTSRSSMDKRRSTPPGWMDIKFCKTNLLIEHKELDGRFQFKFTHPTAGLSKLLLPNPELTTVLGEKRSSSIELRIELRSAEDRVEDNARVNEDLGEPECYYFEEYEAPRMNPSVVAAHKRIGLLQKVQQVARESHEKMQKSMDKMVSKIKSLEKKFLVLQARRSPRLPLSLGVDHSSPPKEAPCPRASQSLFFRAKGRRDNTQRRRKTSKARRSSSTTGLDRVQTEETQLDRAEGRVDLEEPLFEILDSNTINQYQDFSRPWTPTTASSEHKLHQGQGSHTHFEDEEEEERSHKLDRVSRTQLSGVLLMAVYHLQTTT
ncbi:unnamed protein product [Microthlaspi erraticum]|uniref:Arabidopsis retrotransposon Orf1 C-terminal domain-containing protein n=1 Tax=Microthlaspi erraticum TaxID=1685480 RepID=A0A6D2HEW5_9BRAS|nr:unnamed protein product [Microthlaspi erraticum]